MEPSSFVRFQFVRSDDCVSDAIAWFSAGKFSHVDMVLDNGDLLGSRFRGGVLVRKPGYAPWSKCVTIDVPCTALQKAVAVAFAEDQLGKPYDKLAIVGFVVGRSWRDTDAWFCSELAAAAGEKAGLWPPLYSPANRITPAAFALVCSAVPGRIIKVLK